MRPAIQVVSVAGSAWEALRAMNPEQGTEAFSVVPGSQLWKRWRGEGELVSEMGGFGQRQEGGRLRTLIGAFCCVYDEAHFVDGGGGYVAWVVGWGGGVIGGRLLGECESEDGEEEDNGVNGTVHCGDGGVWRIGEGVEG